jgi:hypothetical protein
MSDQMSDGDQRPGTTPASGSGGGEHCLAGPPPGGTIRRDNPREQGVIGVARAIAWFTGQGYEVWVPLGEPERYDLLIVDADDRIQRVEVKTTTHRNERGDYVVQIKTCGGNQSWNGTVKKFDPTRVDFLFVLTDRWEEYVIPAASIRARTSLTLGRDMAPFRVAIAGREEEQLRLENWRGLFAPLAASTYPPESAEGCPSGQRERAVNASAQPTEVRILLPPRDPGTSPSA